MHIASIVLAGLAAAGRRACSADVVVADHRRPGAGPRLVSEQPVQPRLRIFIISLERCADRRRHMERLTSRLGLDVEFIAAVDGQRLSSEARGRYDAEKTRLVYGAEMSDAEIACYLSHYSVYKKIADEDIGLSLIIEDDVDCVEDLVELIAELIAQPDPVWGVVRLQSPKASVLNPTTSRSRGVKITDLSQRALYRLETNVLGGCAYLIRNQAARTMLRYGERIFLPIDQTLDRYWENGILPYVVRPFPVWQHAHFASAIGLRGRDVSGVGGRLHTARRRTRRALDGLNKRLFHVAVRQPWLARGLAAVGVASARLALSVYLPRPAPSQPLNAGRTS